MLSTISPECMSRRRIFESLGWENRHYITQSSAKGLADDEISGGRSLSKGSRTLPCGTPEFTEIGWDAVSSIETGYSRLARKEGIQLITWLFMFRIESFCSNR